MPRKKTESDTWDPEMREAAVKFCRWVEAIRARENAGWKTDEAQVAATIEVYPETLPQ